MTAYSAGPNLGSEFVITVPALPEASRKPKEDRIDPPSSELPRGLSILVVDDNEDVAEATAAILELKGCEVHTASDGRSAIQAIRDFGPQVVLLDIGLPEIDGYEVARQLRALPLADKLILIAVSGYGRAEDIARSAESGFDHHLVKPVDVSVLANVLRQFLVRGALSQRSQELQPSRI